MTWKTLIFSTPCKLYIKNFQLVYERSNNEEIVHIPIEDIGAIMLENQQITLTNYMLSLCSDNNITIYTCDKKHQPVGVLLPFYQHSRTTKIALSQVEMKEPLKKKLWQRIIKQKIINQSNVIKLLFENDERKHLFHHYKK